MNPNDLIQAQLVAEWMECVEARNLFQVQRFLRGGLVDVDVFEQDWNALSLASRHGDLRVVRVLLEHGAAVDLKNWDGQTALHWASSHQDVTRLLLEHHANPNMKDDRGATALHGASSCGCVGAMRLLIEHGANIEEKDMFGYTPLHHICIHKGKWAKLDDVAKFLVQNGANVRTTDNKGVSLLWSACLQTSVEIVRLLLKHGAAADINSKREGQTLLHRYALRNRPNLLEVLLVYGASPISKDMRGRTPLDLACKPGGVARLTSVYLLLQRMIGDGSVTFFAREIEKS